MCWDFLMIVGENTGRCLKIILVCPSYSPFLYAGLRTTVVMHQLHYSITKVGIVLQEQVLIV